MSTTGCDPKTRTKVTHVSCYWFPRPWPLFQENQRTALRSTHPTHVHSTPLYASLLHM